MRTTFLLFAGSMLAMPAVLHAEDAYAAQLAELRQVKQRMIDELTFRGLPDSALVRGEVEFLDRSVDGWLAEAGGYWTKWKNLNHPDLTYNAVAFAVPLELARAYHLPASRYYHDPRVLAAIEGGLRHLATFAYPGCKQPRNWWAWQLGMPIYLTPTLVLLEHDLDRELFLREVATVQYLLKADDEVKLTGAFDGPAEQTPGQTDMNELWFKRVRLELAVLVENPAMAGKWARAAFAEMGAPGSGPLQADWSYKFHGEIPMWAYGRSFVMEYALLILRYADTYLGPSPGQLGRYGDWLEHFVNGFHYRLRLCPAMIGREVSCDPCAAEDPSGLLALAIMAKTNHPRASEFARLFAREAQGLDLAQRWPPHAVNPDTDWMTRLAGRIENVPTAEPAPPVSDNFAYPDSDYLQVTRPGWAVGIKLHSRRNRGYESILGQNLQGWYLSCGSTFHYLRGDEWDHCWPTLDWTRLPGTTVSDRVKKQNESAFVGVLRGSEQVALAALELKRDGFAARKSWFVDGDAIICLGSDIVGPGRVETTVVNQPVPAGAPLWVDGERASDEPFERTMTVHHLWLAGMGYVFPGGAQVQVLRATRTSDWGSIRDRKQHMPGTPVTHQYVTAVIAHDADVRGYRYIMVPNVELAAWPARAEALQRAYALGTAGAHTVRSRDGHAEAVILWSAGTAGPVRADCGCIALNAGDGWQVVDPTWNDQPLEIAVAGQPQTLQPAQGRPVRVVTERAFGCAPPSAEDLFQAQKLDLVRIKQRMVAEWTLRDAEHSPLVKAQVQMLDERVDYWLKLPSGYWSAWRDVHDPLISLTGAAFSVPTELARAYRSPASRHYHSHAVLTAIERGLRHLEMFAQPGCKQPHNWWAWQIGIPTNVITMLILMEGDLDAELFAREVITLKYLLKATDEVKAEGAFAANTAPKPGRTDMNALWAKRLRFQLGVLIENPAMAGKWAAAAMAEMGPPGGGYLQADWSYKFHGQKPMWAYGRAYLIEYALLLGWCDGTYVAASAEQVERYAGMLEHFVNGFLYRGQLCPAMIGREISRSNVENTGIPAALGVMARVDHPRAAEFAALYARESRLIDPTAGWIGPLGEPERRWMTRPATPAIDVPAMPPAPQVDDVCAYPDGDFLQVTRPEWAVGIKLHSSRNAGYESINGENLQGWYLSHGSTFHYLQGDEWAGGWPTIDWTRLPGTTVSSEVKKQNESPFVGVLRGSNRVGLAALELRREGFSAHKSWLVDGDTIVCLGSDISGPGRVETTVLNQRVAADAPLMIDGQRAPAEPFARDMIVQNLWVANMGYVFPSGARVHVVREARTSDWSSIRDPDRHVPGEVVTHHYVTVVITHGANADGYRYLMLPNVKADAWPDTAREALARYDLGTDGAHTVRSRDGSVESIVLWTAGQAGPMRADRGCMALGVHGEWQLVDPTWGKRPLNVVFNGQPQTLELSKGRPVPLGR